MADLVQADFPYTDVRNAVWFDAAETVINCEVKFERFEDYIPYSAAATDITLHCPKIFADLVAGRFGPIAPYAAPTAAQLRAQMRSLTRRQFFIAMMQLGVDKIDVLGKIDQIEDPYTQLLARIEFDEATSFERLNVFVTILSEDLGLTPEQVDEAWIQAVSL